jgi:hypothetical protein
MVTIRASLVVVAATFGLAVSAGVAASAPASRLVGHQLRSYDLAASGDRDSRNKNDDDSTQGQFGPRNSSRGLNTGDDDDAPRVRRRPDDQTTRDRIDRGDLQQRDMDRLKGRNFRD